MNVRIARRSNDQCGTPDVPQTVLHPIAIHHPVAFRGHLARPQGIDDEALDAYRRQVEVSLNAADSRAYARVDDRAGDVVRD